MSSPSTTSRFSDEDVGERRVADGRAQIGEQAEVLAQPEQAGFGAHLVGHLVPFRPADRAEEHGVGGERLRHVRFGDRLAVRVVGRSRRPDPPRSRSRRRAPSFMTAIERLHLGHGLGADAVAGEKEKFLRDAIRNLGESAALLAGVSQA